MTDHSIEELKRQWQKADVAVSSAIIARRERREPLTAALARQLMKTFTDMGGEVGVTKVRAAPRWGSADSPDMSQGPYFVMGVQSTGLSTPSVAFKLATVKKDGTPSNKPCARETTVVHILPEDNQ